MRIRVATEADAQAVSDIYAPAVLERSTSFELIPPDARAMASRIEKTLAHYPWIVCEVEGSVVGYAYASVHNERAAYRWSADVSAYVSGSAHRRGVGSALYASLFEILVLQGIRNVYAGITLPNPASEGLHRSIGFTPVGIYHQVGYKFDAWHDVIWLERQIAERVIDPPEPIPFRQLAAAAVLAALRAGQRLVKTPAPSREQK